MRSKPISKEMVLAAMAKTKSNMAAARYLHCSLQHYRKWAMLYEATEPGFKSLYHQHKNQSGKGIPKFIVGKKNEPALKEIIEGRISSDHFTPQKIKQKMIYEGYMEEKCNRCGFEERRVLDYKVPLLMNFKDNNKKNYSLDNVELLCYNCYFLNVGNIFNDDDIRSIETDIQVKSTSEATNWEVSDYQSKRLKELGFTEEDLKEFNNNEE